MALGIDVAEARKGLDLVALDSDRRVLACRRRATLADVASTVSQWCPDVICIDSPPAWSASGRSRTAERELRSQFGITAFATPTDPGPHPFYAWMRVGFTVFDAVAVTHPRYRQGAVIGTAAEVFPNASAQLLAGRRRAGHESKGVFRRSVLTSCGVDVSPLRSIDAVDAALAALTGVIASEGNLCLVGEPEEGVIVLPQRGRSH